MNGPDETRAAPVAIVGIGVRFPGGAGDPDSLWANLLAGVDAIGPVPPSRWDSRRFRTERGSEPGKTYVGEGGFLDGSPFDLDASFFGMSPREAAQLDPQQRLLIEATWEAIEDAGLRHEDLRRRAVGVFVGGFTLDTMIQRLGLLSRDDINSHTATSSTMVMLSNRVSHTFDFAGPSMTVDTACSSSLVATHLACQSVRSGESELAFACGVNVMLRPEYVLAMSKGGFLSRSGRCRAFDASADGYVRGEGVGVVALKSLARARADGDRIYATILATGANQDGRTPGIAMPSAESQMRLLERVHGEAGVDPDALAYIEAHGPGTLAGDPVEARSLGEVLARRRAGGRPVWMGSIKTNIGHTEAAAGVAGLIKAALVLHRREVPPNLHFRVANPAIDLDGLGLRIPTERQPLPADGPMHAAVNSFGYGGTNAHAVLGTPPPVEPSPARPGAGSRPFVVSAADGAALGARAGQVRASLDAWDDNGGDLDRLGYTLGCRRSHLRQRALVWASTREELGARLGALADGAPDAHTTLGHATERPPRLLFVYTGMGAQYGGMGRGLYAEHEAFRRVIDAFDDVYCGLGGWSVGDFFRGDGSPVADGVAIEQPFHAQPANLALQMALTALWRAWGVAPDGVTGHSVGEIAALWAAGCLTLEEAVGVIHARSELQQRLLGRGGMLTVGLGVDQVAPHLARYDGAVEVAGINAPDSTTLCGDPAALDALLTEFDRADVFARPLRVGVAYHGRQMEEIDAAYRERVASLTFRAPTVAVYSTVTGARFDPERPVGLHLYENARAPVRFQAAVEAALDDGFGAFLDVGPHRVLSAAVASTARGRDARVWAGTTLQRGEPADDRMRRALGEVHGAGVPVDFGAWFEARPMVVLPTYPWQRARLWQETEAARADLTIQRLASMLHQRVRGSTDLPTWIAELTPGFFPFLADHVVAGDAILPAAGTLAVGLAALRDAGRSPVLERVRFERPVALEGAPTVTIRLHPRTREIHLLARVSSDEEWRRFATAVASVEVPRHPPRVDAGLLRARCPDEIDVEAYYAGLAAAGLAYGPAFRAIERLSVGSGEFFAEIALPAGLEPMDFEHPVLLDAGFQALFALLPGGLAGGAMVPVEAARVEARAPMPARVLVHGVLESHGAGHAEADLRYVDPGSGEPLVSVDGLRCRALPRAREDAARAFEETWVAVESVDPGAPEPGERVVVGGGALASALAAALGASRVASVAEVRASDLASVDGLRLVLVDDTPLAPAGAPLACFGAVARLVREAPDGAVQVTVVTVDGTAAAASPDPDQAARWGLGRVLANEHPGADVRLVDASADLPVAALAERVGGRAVEPEIRVEPGRLRAPRVAPFRDPVVEPARVRCDEAPVELALAEEGNVDGLRWVRSKRRPPGPGQVEIRTTHTALNFKDVLKVLGMLSTGYLRETFYTDHLGMETVGEIVAVGDGVQGWSVGDRVVVPNAGGTYRSYATADTRFLIRCPAPFDPAQAPILINYITAFHALEHLARLRPDETVLIHSAAGGVGQAAIAVARRIGATVLGTAGSEDKRARLREQGVTAFDSRSLDFVEGVRDATGGRGPDVVLNSLSGDLLVASWNVLAPYGRFVEIGKRDLEDDAPLPLGRFDHNRSFLALDIDRMMHERPARFRALLDEVFTLLDDGSLPPIPVRTHPAHDVVGAFRSMSRASHFGKLVVALDRHEVDAWPSPDLDLSGDHAHLVTGGLGGFGARVATWLADRGARRLWLVGRRGLSTPGAPALVASLEARGVKVRVDALDITDEAAVRAALDDVTARFAPVGGVFHAAMVLADGPLDALDEASLERVFAPKARGADVLDRLTRGHPIRQFVLFSSISALIGNPGQGSYVAANAWLDALAHRRRAEGLPGLSVNWGVIGDTGVVARDDALAGHLRRMGVRGVPSAACVEGLGHLLRVGATQACFADVDWGRWVAASGRPSPRFAALVEADPGARSATAEFRARVLAAGEPPVDHVLALLRGELGFVLQMEAQAVPVDRPLDAIGVDSLMSVEFSRRVEATTGVTLPTALLMRGPTLEALTTHLLGDVLGVADLTDQDVDGLSDEEADAMLLLLAREGALDESDLGVP